MSENFNRLIDDAADALPEADANEFEKALGKVVAAEGWMLTADFVRGMVFRKKFDLLTDKGRQSNNFHEEGLTKIDTALLMVLGRRMRKVKELSKDHG